MIKREIIVVKGGHKNKTYQVKNGESSHFWKIKQYDKFNHKIKYEKLSQFNFIPKLIENNKKELIWEWIEGKNPEMISKNINTIAQMLKELHNSKLLVPKSNHLKRIKKYFKEVKNKDVPKEVHQFYKKAFKIAQSIESVTPLHNDPWINNFIINEKKKIYLVDWEFSTMGDKHFDLAFFIDGSQLDKKQEAIFLKEYADYDSKRLNEMKFLVNYLNLVWMHRFDKLPFSDQKTIENLNNIK